ncbi:hypothetical protein ACS0TY_022412 [Phlomoides rotata]
MSTYSKRSTAGRVLPIGSAFQRSAPLCNPTGVTSDSSHITSSSFASYSSSSSTGFFDQRRSVSPSRVNLHALSPPPSTRSVRFSVDSSGYPRRSIAVTPPRKHVLQNGSAQKKTCLCSPTTHPGSFRCALHKNISAGVRNHSIAYSPNRLNMRRSAMTNSLVRIGTVEGDLVKRALASLIRPSSHQQRRRADFQRRSSRLSAMSRADDL